MSFETLFLSLMIFAGVLIGAVTLAHVTHVISPTTAARILMGVPLALGILGESWLAFLLLRNDNVGTALYVQIPLIALFFAFAGTIRPASGWVAVQGLICVLLLLLSILTIFTAGIFIFMLDVIMFFGMMYTAAAVAERPNPRNDAFWRYYFSLHA